MGDANELRLREEITSPWGDQYIAEWYCDVPPPGAGYTVIREEWTADYTTRKIYEIEIAG